MAYQGLDKAMAQLKSKAKENALDYSFIMHCLKNYASPRSKLTQLIKSEALIRIKKGLYVFSEPYLKENLSLEVLANLAYGPSYVSLEWALQKYHFIPEYVAEVTSVTAKKSYKFTCSLARFSYAHVPSTLYATGVTQMEGALMATPEKALTDFLIIRRGRVTSIKEMRLILFEDMRVDDEVLFGLDLNLIKLIYENYKHSAIYYLIKVLEKGQGG